MCVVRVIRTESLCNEPQHLESPRGARRCPGDGEPNLVRRTSDDDRRESSGTSTEGAERPKRVVRKMRRVFRHHERASLSRTTASRATGPGRGLSRRLRRVENQPIESLHTHPESRTYGFITAISQSWSVSSMCRWANPSAPSRFSWTPTPTSTSTGATPSRTRGSRSAGRC